MWMAGAVAAGLLWRWPAVLILVKPTLLPFALIGVRSRAWWALAAVVVAVTLAGPWQDYLTAGRNLQVDLAYSLGSVPLLLLPVIAWWARGSRRP